MVTRKDTWGFLSGNHLKLIAAAAMLADHVGLMFFPNVPLLRLIGRLAYPIFAYMIAEGCRYTRSKKRYFLQIFSLAAVCQLVYYLADGSMYLSILVTFSCSIAMIFALQEWKLRLIRKQRAVLGAALFLSAVVLVWILNDIFTIDYGFWGCMVPVFASLFQPCGRDDGQAVPALNRKEIHVLTMGVGLVLLAWDLGGNQIWALLSLSLLLCYTGSRGKLRMKYFFYIFYPLHLALLQVISWLL